VENQKHSHTLTRDQDQLISFVVGGEDYGIDIQRVKEVIRIREITKLPKCPVFVKGVINLRGDVIPIIDLREKFGLPHEEYTDMTRVIVVEVDEKSIGMVVDSVSHVIRLSEDEIEPPPPLIGGLSSEFRRKVRARTNGRACARLIGFSNRGRR
jgi:purine-binding chemotaxis protein CheW